MPRVVEQSGDWFKFVPQVFGIREAYLRHLRGEEGGDPEPVTVEIRWMDAATFRKATRLTMFPQERGKLEPKAEAMQSQIFAKYVGKVSHYTINEKPIVDGKDLYERGEIDIVNEVMLAITELSTLQEGDLDRLRSLSVSSPPDTRA